MSEIPPIIRLVFTVLDEGKVYARKEIEWTGSKFAAPIPAVGDKVSFFIEGDDHYDFVVEERTFDYSQTEASHPHPETRVYISGELKK